MEANCLRTAVSLAADVALGDIEDRNHALDREARSTEVGDIRFGDARAGGMPTKSEQPQQCKEEWQAHSAIPRRSEGKSSRLSSSVLDWKECRTAHQLANWEELLCGEKSSRKKGRGDLYGVRVPELARR
jgi:hypothetical protein